MIATTQAQARLRLRLLGEAIGREALKARVSSEPGWPLFKSDYVPLDHLSGIENWVRKSEFERRRKERMAAKSCVVMKSNDAPFHRWWEDNFGKQGFIHTRDGKYWADLAWKKGAETALLEQSKEPDIALLEKKDSEGFDAWWTEYFSDGLCTEYDDEIKDLVRKSWVVGFSRGLTAYPKAFGTKSHTLKFEGDYINPDIGIISPFKPTFGNGALDTEPDKAEDPISLQYKLDRALADLESARDQVRLERKSVAARIAERDDADRRLEEEKRHLEARISDITRLRGDLDELTTVHTEVKAMHQSTSCMVTELKTELDDCKEKYDEVIVGLRVLVKEATDKAAELKAKKDENWDLYLTAHLQRANLRRSLRDGRTYLIHHLIGNDLDPSDWRSWGHSLSDESAFCRSAKILIEASE